MLKRMIIGTYHSVDADHVDRYIDEETFRFNTRKQTDSERFQRTVGKVAGKKAHLRRAYRERVRVTQA